jgi:hypothetical protein
LTRRHTETVKIGREKTELNAACYLHVAYDEDGRVCGVSLSSPGKFEGGALDRLFRKVNGHLEAAFEPLPVAAILPARPSSGEEAGTADRDQAKDRMSGAGQSNDGESAS